MPTSGGGYGSPVSWLTEPDSDWDAPDPDDEPRNRLRLVALLAGTWLAVSVVVLIVLLLVGGHHSASDPTTTGHSSTAAESAGPSPSDSPPAVAVPAGWTRRAADRQTNCAAHAYGQIAAFFTRTPCTSVSRLLATTLSGRRAIVIASHAVTFPEAAQAKSYLTLVNADGTGNVADLLREGVRYPGGPSALPTAAFASRQDGTTVHVVEAAYAAGTSSATDPTLQSVARQGL